MNILIDECLPRYLKRALKDFSPKTVQDAGWAGVKNGPLLGLAEQSFDVFLTADQNLRYQQNLRSRKIAIILLSSPRLSAVKQSEPRLREVLGRIKPGEYVEL